MLLGASQARKYTRKTLNWKGEVGMKRVYGAPGRSRTSDLLVRSQLLYPAELRAHIALNATL